MAKSSARNHVPRGIEPSAAEKIALEDDKILMKINWACRSQNNRSAGQIGQRGNLNLAQ